MSKYVKTDQLIRDLEAMKTIYDAISLDGMIRALEERAVDAVEVIRCEECKFSALSKEELRYCACEIASKNLVLVVDDDFCSCGERRERND